jgi:hypothetical protein
LLFFIKNIVKVALPFCCTNDLLITSAFDIGLTYGLLTGAIELAKTGECIEYVVIDIGL